jgi:hypothetical protein
MALFFRHDNIVGRVDLNKCGLKTDLAGNTRDNKSARWTRCQRLNNKCYQHKHFKLLKIEDSIGLNITK